MSIDRSIYRESWGAIRQKHIVRIYRRRRFISLTTDLSADLAQILPHNGCDEHEEEMNVSDRVSVALARPA